MCIRDSFYTSVAKTISFKAPVPNFEKLINPYFGRFGMRWHPVIGSPHYFHIGIDINSPETTPFNPIEKGLLDYSGYANINGNYIVIRHPHIITEDGFVLHSLYMHCKTVNVEFSCFQKFLRRFICTCLLYTSYRLPSRNIFFPGVSQSFVFAVYSS